MCKDIQSGASNDRDKVRIALEVWEKTFYEKLRIP